MHIQEALVKFHVCNSSGKLDRVADHLRKIGESSLQLIKARLPVSNVDVVLYHNPAFVIPETGMAGTAQTAHAVWISLDPDNPNFDRNLEEEFTATLAHELHHCMRWRGPGTGYFTNLREALVTDGLAVAFELEFRRGVPAIAYVQDISSEEASRLLALAKREFATQGYDHREWFFSGSEARQIPPFAGYRLGHHVVKGYLAATGRSPGQLWNEPAQSFL